MPEESATNLFGEDRMAIYAKASPEPEAEVDAGASVDTATEQEGAPKEEYQPEPPVKEDAETVAKEDKTVPYGALKEEREKRKALQKSNDELTQRLQQVLGDFQAYVQEGKKGVAEPETVEDYDREIVEARNKIKNLEAKIASLEGNFQTEQQKKAQNDLQARLSGVSADLEKEGYPGFLEFLGNVQSELSRIAAEDMDEARSFDNPEGWKRIYKEKVFPSLSQIFSKKESADRKSSKEDAKRDVQGAVLTPGSAPAGEKSEKEWSYEDYLKMRSESFAGGHGRK